jgi:hypothetical protein
MPADLSQIRVALVLVAMLTLPGWAALALSGLWRKWETLQRWIVAIGVSVAFYPVLFYGARWLLPFLTFGPYKMSALLVLCLAVIAWRMRRHWREQFSFDRLEWVAMAVFGMTLFTRFWIIRDHPYPAWSDSLHHALLTRLTAVQGQLPTSMEPYFPIPLDQYHLGLYSLTATTQWLAQVPAHTALLWTAQALNGLCGLGVYLVLDRKVGRVGGIVGAVTVGLLSHQPAFYVNWGRFTQLSSQTIILTAWVVTWDALRAWRSPQAEGRTNLTWLTALAAVLNAAVFLLHFRVAAFYLPLLAAAAASELWVGQREKGVRGVLIGLGAVGLASLLAIAPAAGAAVPAYLTTQSRTIASSQATETVQLYYEFAWPAVPYLVARQWVLYLAILGIIVGLVRRDAIVMISTGWVAILWMLGHAYLLSIPVLSLTNLGAVLIALYLPVGLTIGAATNDLLRTWEPLHKGLARDFVAVLAVVGGLASCEARASLIEPHRFFVKPEDVAAMGWIRENIPQQARFAVNTYFWLPRAPHGTDAGYWIPYFTGRGTTAGTMLLNLGPPEYIAQVVEMSRAAEELEDEPSSIETLTDLGVNYVYVGKNGDFSGSGLEPSEVGVDGGAEVVYEKDGVAILQLQSPAGAY